jgi:hypothetical protein
MDIRRLLIRKRHRYCRQCGKPMSERTYDYTVRFDTANGDKLVRQVTWWMCDDDYHNQVMLRDREVRTPRA